MQVFLGIMMVCGYLDMVGSEGCVLASDYICKVLPQSFPPGLSSIVILVSNLREINSSMFSGETLESVSSLTIANAGITTVSTGAFQSFCQLKKLSLYQNNLSQISVSWFCQPANLENLTLFQNDIEILEEHSLTGLSGLTSLNLANNKIYTIALRSFYTQNRLAHLDLSGNKLTRLSPETYLPLHSTQMRLEGNPWDCSCEVKDFVLFLKGMINASLLENGMEVTCETPALLKGQNVQNVSDCIPSSRYILNEEVLLQIVLTVIGFLGALCILLCVACPLYKMKQKPKKVEPDLESPGNNSILEEKGTQKQSKSWDCKQGAWPLRDSRIRGRAQSVGAELSTCKFSYQSFKTENDGCPGQLELHEKKGHYVNMSEMDNTEQDTGGQILASMSPQVTENLPYLSIGTNPVNCSPGCPEDHHGDNMGRGLRKEIRRISTWPITFDQWREKHTIEDKIFRLFPNTTDRNKIICDLECMDGFEREDFFLESPPRDSVNGVFPRADRGFAAEEDDCSAIKTATLEGDTVLLCLNEEPITQSHACSYQVSTRKSNFPGQKWNQLEPHDEHDKAYGPSLKLGCEWEMERETQATHGMAREVGCLCSSGVSLASHSRSSPQDPQDENLLQGNEYAFIDLLHEVVQNQGRWTRDRWKQTHLNKHRKPSHTH
ncbi:uncharacterized protein LOC118206898 [Anguilla anguilla]|uniref:uncharacterized protein LOC118206898 n=1 Tax=Anguilla anguilla TaxID=7936 RepID=UPI0015ACFC8E|nr:uncharacterized protein LOC118206898 [Anguilla anguilla]